MLRRVAVSEQLLLEEKLLFFTAEASLKLRTGWLASARSVFHPYTVSPASGSDRVEPL